MFTNAGSVHHDVIDMLASQPSQPSPGQPTVYDAHVITRDDVLVFNRLHPCPLLCRIACVSHASKQKRMVVVAIVGNASNVITSILLD
jgi:hypothetical protein